MTVRLPEPQLEGSVSLEQALFKRRCVRRFSNTPLTLKEISQLLWAAQGTTSPRGQRTCPSAGALYPLETLVVAGNVDELGCGIYRYSPADHELTLIRDGDFRAALADAGLRQSSIRTGAINLVLSAIYERTTRKYGRRGNRYVDMEAGHAAQNVCLQAAALGLGTVMIGAFHDNDVREILHLPADEAPLYILPVGKK
jgi:SagB-type dehydrogenase family enzyme